MTSKKRAGLIVLVLAVGVLGGVVLAQTESHDKDIPPQPEDMIFEWTAPTTGSAPVKYLVEIRVGGMNSEDIATREVTTNRVTFPVAWLTLYEVRVRGVDANNNIGPWSAWSVAEDRDHDDPSF